MDVTLTKLTADGAQLSLFLPVAMLVAAALGLLVLGLSARISQLRLGHGVSLGDGGVKPLVRAIRAHGNTLEYSPLVVIMLALYEMVAGSSVFLIVVAAAFVASRYLYAWGLLSKAFSRRRQLGTLITYVVILVMSIALLVAAWPAIAG